MIVAEDVHQLEKDVFEKNAIKVFTCYMILPEV